MTRRPETDAIEERIVGDSKLARLAAQGLAPLPPERLIPLQVRLALSDEEEVADLARQSLDETDPRIVAPVLAAEPDATTLTYFAIEGRHPLILETVLRRRDLPAEVLVDLAQRIPAGMQDVLILRQDAILESPEILDALESNPHLEDRIGRRIREYREHLVRESPERPPAPAVDEDDGEHELASPEEVVEAIQQAFEEPVEGEIDDETGLSEGQIRTLSVPVRLQLARGSGRALRDILIRDSNPQVATAVFTHNSFSDGDVERVAKMRNVVEDVLEAIGRDSRWVRRYPIALALVKNPRTPIPIAVGLVPRLAVRDLQLVRRDRNVSEAVRSRAQALFSLKVG